ncbi:glycosyltransferase family 2 protein [Streptococcus pneumoniae]|nr:glycosyltransferase family 2 protein [Streptococcus pneumoniae]MDS2333674.1 glycosyltransferase family 2 protein [Streptococcus pneumoniae]MDS2572622.1 glycosyltransferase family 2 protein [Streptococcus pneumoniae]MDS2609729.1 glycosyltransferase family 2 protein [Streptococcus pneumoniae]MDS2611167.1 glycosyltransferase family 2 protein [Streptococcus pneumoniae]
MISIIVPVYNVKDYLHYAMESLFRQTYTDFEVILVNDGSTDSSGELCNRYAENHENVYVFHKKNGGLSDARNFGVTKASSDWIVFLDPDDYFEVDALELLVKIQQRYDADLISTKVKSTSTYEDYNSDYMGEYVYSNLEVLSKEEALELMLQDKVATVSACAKLYHKSILERAPFPIGKVYEDFYVVGEHLALANRIVISPYKTYNYFCRPGSIVRSKFTVKRFNFFEAAEHNRSIIKKYYNSKNLENVLNTKIVQGSFSIASSAAESDVESLLAIRKKLSSLYWSVFTSPKASYRLKLKYTLFLLFPKGYYKLKKMIKRVD